MTYDYSLEEPTPPIDPRDEAYTEACEEIERLKKIIERMKRKMKTTR
jgi:hypothetical protein